MRETFRSLADRFHQADPAVAFAFILWDGERIEFGEKPAFTLHIKSEKSAREIAVRRFFGFGEAYTSGEIEVEGSMEELLRLGLAIRFDNLEPNALRKLRLIPDYLKTRCTPGRAKKNISYHYDRGNDFYRLYLDNTMTYSCAYFTSRENSLEQAQMNKYEHISRKLMLKPGERLLDVGCGWGSMLIYAALNYGITGLGITLSKNQCEYANDKIRELGLESSISVALADYRSLKGEFDKFVSIGMFEHVGKEFIPTFMRAVSGLLKDGGLGLLHTIGLEFATSGDSWHMTYIFPGGYIPELSEVVGQLGQAGFSVLDVENLRIHYALTLDRWVENFEKNEDKIRQMFDERFVRMWRLYLQSSSAGFRYGDNRLFQVLFSKGLNNDLPTTREYLYR